MPKVQITVDVFKNGAAEYKRGSVVDVDQPTADKLVRRGQATTKIVEEPKADEKKADAGDEKKGGKK